MKGRLDHNHLYLLQELIQARIDSHKSTVSQFHNDPDEVLFELLAKELDALTDKFEMPVIFTVTDENGRITYVNNLFSKVTGFSGSDVIGNTHRVISAHHHNSAFYHELWTTIRNGGSWYGEMKDRSKSGDTFWLDTLITPVSTSQGSARHYLAIRSTMAERKESRNQGINQIPLFIAGKEAFLSPESIRIVVARGDYTEVHSINGKSHLFLKTMKDWLKVLDPNQFFHVHRSYLVNLAYINKLAKENRCSWLLTISGLDVPIRCSRRNVAALKKALCRPS